MVADGTLGALVMFLVVSLGIGCAGYFLMRQTFAYRRRAVSRLRDLSSEPVVAPPELGKRDTAWPVLRAIGSLIIPGPNSGPAALKDQLFHAGIFSPFAPVVFYGVKLSLMVSLAIVGAIVAYMAVKVSPRWIAVFSLSACSVGMLAPEVWLRSRVKKRQAVLRAALPDALDMLVLCLEGGVSFVAGFERVVDELEIVHPLLGAEFTIVQREIELGLSTGEALKRLAERSGLEEIRDLASIVLQCEISGTGIVKALRAHADASRLERQYRAMEIAQKAAVKILFPTLLFIFPAIFIVLLGPAAFQIADMFKK